jgi:hypothetical protein
MMLGSAIPLAAMIAATVTPWFTAIRYSVSPDFTV